MSHIYDSLKNIITSELVIEATNFTQEDSLKIESALNYVVVAILESLLMVEDDNSAIEFALRKAGKEYAQISSSFQIIFSGNADEKTYYLGGRFMDALLQNKASDFATLIANESGISNKSADKLIFVFTPIIASSLGNTLIIRKINLSRLIVQIDTEKYLFSKYSPSGLYKLLNGQSPNKTSNLTYADAASPPLKVNKNGANYLIWGVIISVLILLFLLWFYYL